MAIKVSVGEPKPQEVKDYPKLMKDQDGDIFYMVSHKVGLPLTGDWDWNTKDLPHGWDMVKFTDYEGEITLKNE